jgi:cobalt-zinc-cadmium efflux system outer membrane protein
MRRLTPFALALVAASGIGWAQQHTAESAREEADQSVSGFSSNGDIQLNDYMRLALDRNPGLSRALAQYRSVLQRLPQVSALPDPMLAFTNYIRTPETRVGSQTNAITLSQQFPWFGTLGMREQVAAKEAASYRQQYEAAKDEVVRQAKTAYYNLAFIDLAVDINDEERLLLDHYEKLAESRYQQGAGLQQAAVKLQAEITRVQSRLAELRSRRVDAEASLNTLMNRPAETPVAKIKLPPIPAVDIDYKQLYQVGRRNRPEVLASLLEIERDEKRIDLARKDYWPSFSVGGTFINVLARPVAPGAMAPDSNGMNVWSVNLGINLPLHRSKYDAEVAEATEAKVASTHGYQATVNGVESSIREVGFRIGTLREQMTLFNTTLVPQTQQSLQSAEAAYSTGSLGVLDLLDSERVLLDVRLGLAQLIADYMKSLADMERALGAPFPEVKP